MLPFPVALSGPRPAAAQIVDAAQLAIANGTLVQGDPFPSVREISRELKVNPKTAHKAVQQLLQANLLSADPGQGAVVAWTPPQRKPLDSETLAELKRWAIEARLRGADLDSQRDALESIWNEFPTL